MNPPAGHPQSSRESTHDDMLAYYEARAREYERIYDKPERQDDLARLRVDLAQRLAGRRILELACGTGYWTAVLAPRAAAIHALDMAAQTLAVAAAKPALQARVTLAQGDAYAPAQALGGQRFDALFAGFWLSHVPRERLKQFLDAMTPVLEPGALVVFLDNRLVPGSSTPISETDAAGNTYQARRLDDGSTHRVLKNFPTSAQLQHLLGDRASAFAWHELPYYWWSEYLLDAPTRAS